MMRTFHFTALVLSGSLTVFALSGAIAQEQTQPASEMPATNTFGRWTTIIDTLDTARMRTRPAPPRPPSSTATAMPGP